MASQPCTLCKKKCYDRQCAHCFVKICFACYNDKHAKSCKKKDNSWDSYTTVTRTKKAPLKQPVYPLSESESDSNDNTKPRFIVHCGSHTDSYNSKKRRRNLKLNITSSSSDSVSIQSSDSEQSDNDSKLQTVMTCSNSIDLGNLNFNFKALIKNNMKVLK